MWIAITLYRYKITTKNFSMMMVSLVCKIVRKLGRHLWNYVWLWERVGVHDSRAICDEGDIQVVACEFYPCTHIILEFTFGVCGLFVVFPSSGFHVKFCVFSLFQFSVWSSVWVVIFLHRNIQTSTWLWPITILYKMVSERWKSHTEACLS